MSSIERSSGQKPAYWKTGKSMPDPDLLALFRLLANRPRLLELLLQRYGSAGAVINNVTEDELQPLSLERIDFDRCRTVYAAKVDRDIKWLQQPHHHLITLTDGNYPALLREIHDPPVLLFARGNLQALTSPGIAMVGSRNPTRSGMNTARMLAADLANAGFVVISGMALGIDAAGHRGALNADAATIAVFGTGCDLIYPSRHRRLADEIVERGLLLSEFPLGTRSRGWHFPRRNRVVSGLSLGTIVVEAALPSGSLISANYAMEQGREVFAVPGSIHIRQSRGCHQLIRDGATLVENANDILSQFSFMTCKTINRPEPTLTELQSSLLEHLDAQSRSTDEISMALDLPVEKVVSTLIELEILKLVCQEKGGYLRSVSTG